MRILIDKYVPFVQGVLEPYANVEYLSPEEFTIDKVRDAHALIVRTRTKCDERLLADSQVSCITTATIGYEHIDTAYCETHQIKWYNAPGCNAAGVCDYVEDAISVLQREGKLPLHPIVGIVGVGHVGRLVETMVKAKGWLVMKNDPPRAEIEPNEEWTSLTDIAKQADIITFHTPMTCIGKYPSYHLCDALLLSLMKPSAVVINASRGGVVDEVALRRSSHICVLDTWETEPQISEVMLRYATIATPHIAGYTLQGKINASNACLENICKHFGWPVQVVDMSQVPAAGDREEGWIRRADKVLRAHPKQFEYLRESYKLR